MKELPMIVAQTKVGKVVNVKIWRNKKLISKKITLGRLETSEDFKATKPKSKNSDDGEEKWKEEPSNPEPGKNIEKSD